MSEFMLYVSIPDRFSYQDFLAVLKIIIYIAGIHCTGLTIYTKRVKVASFSIVSKPFQIHL